MRSNKGFTLIELMIVVAIVAILATVIIPSYSDYIKRGKITEATSNLAGLRVSMEQYYQDNRTYVTAGACGIGAVPTATPNFTYACVATAIPPTYTITATGQPSMAGFAYTINELNAKWTTVIPAGWGVAPISCWVTKPGGTC